MASGVQGRMDLTVPGGAGSSVAFVFTVDVGKCEAGMGRSVEGEMCRTLRTARTPGISARNSRRVKRSPDVLVIKVEQELMMQPLDVLQGRDTLLQILIPRASMDRVINLRIALASARGHTILKENPPS